jgi:alanine dehydrogenase
VATLVLTSGECEALLDHAVLRRALALAHAALSRGQAAQPRPPRMAVGADSPGEPLSAAVLPMTAAWHGLAVVKLLSDAPLNRQRDLPAQRSTVALFDADTAECLALIDGRALTRIRTASATALATSLLARPGGRTLGLIGAGALALEHVHAHQDLGYDEVVVWSRTAARIKELAEHVPAGVSVLVASTPADVVGHSDVVCTLTPSVSPLLGAADLRPGVHINAVGSPPRPHFRELAEDVFSLADLVVVDALTVALHESGNVCAAVASRSVRECDLVELGDIVVEAHPGRGDDDEITVFNSVGLGLQDLAAAQFFASQARDLGAGREVDVRA